VTVIRESGPLQARELLPLVASFTPRMKLSERAKWSVLNTAKHTLQPSFR